MGSKSSERSVKRALCRCDVCGRRFQTTSALISHLKHVHKKNVVPKVKLRRKIQPAAQMASKTHSTKLAGAGKAEDSKNMSFKCPKCDKYFCIYFSAYRHIQKFHCVDSKGEAVSPTSSQMIKPIRTELCVLCNTQVPTSELHRCPTLTDAPTHRDQYLCMGCDQIFHSLKLFDRHVDGVHGDQFECFFFKSKNDFSKWKLHLETQTKIKYNMLKQQKTTQSYHCSYQPPNTDESTENNHLCPSIIITHEYPEGIQVKYFKTHHGHTCAQYVMPVQLKVNSITSFLREADDIEIQDTDDPKDLYVQFKKMMKNIVIETAKVNISTLNNLIGKVLDMTDVLNSYDEDNETNIVTNISTKANDTSRVLENNKRKLDTVPKDSKKVKFTSHKVENDENSAKNLIPSPKIKKQSTNSSPVPKNSQKINIRSPSFNDSYKEFVDQAFKTVPKSPSSKPKKNVVKTKIGQFKPSLSPRRDVKQRDPNIWKVKPDTQYEVRERENDCNVLILKI